MTGNAGTEEGLVIDRPGKYILRLRLNRPQVLNALSVEVREGLLRVLREIEDDPTQTKVLIFTGTGDFFCSGGDVTEFEGFLGPRPVDGYRAQMRFQDMARLFLQIPCPVIAAVNGKAYGGGTAVAMMSDLRIASERASFKVGQVARALVPDVGLTWILPRLVGTARALEMMLLNEEVTAEEAAAWGFVNRVVPEAEFEQATMAMATKLAESSRTSLEWIKRTTYMNLEQSLDSGLKVEAMSQALLSATDDFDAGIAAFSEKRPAKFG
ncbi:MAG: enoyl-CoA hydratase/isomerase family protein [Solirubrobacterales bacterium]